MHCERCSGVMSYEGFYGWESEAVWYYPGWRCIHCGEIVDTIISLNRRLNKQHQAENAKSKVMDFVLEMDADEADDRSIYASVLDD